MSFSFPLWLFPLVALPGLWIAWRLYASGPPPGRRARGGMLALATATWLLLAWFVVSPLVRGRVELYHPPAVVLAIDEGAGYAALGARDTAGLRLREAFRHYAALDYDVHLLGFAERIGVPGEDAGPLSRASVLRRHLDSLAIPNLQAILIATDGRFFGEVPPGADWPAPVYPVEVTPPTAEVQGEGATVDLRPSGGEAEITIHWRGLGGDPAAAVAVLRDGNRVVWRRDLQAPPGAEPGERIVQRFPLPSGPGGELFERGGDPVDSWFLLVHPPESANTHSGNDTVPVLWRGLGHRQIFLGPLSSLEERGLVDALSESDSQEVRVTVSDEFRAAPGDLVWARAHSPTRADAVGFARAAGVAVVEYRLPGAAGSPFHADARVAWRDDATDFLPAFVLRLGDLGVDTLTLPPPAPSREPLAWAEQGERTGMLIWRDRESGVLGFAVLPLWRSRFQPGAGGGGAGALWTRAAARWMSAEGGVRVALPDTLLAGRPFTVTARVPVPAGESGDPGVYEFSGLPGARAITGIPVGAGRVRFDSVSFPPGRHAVRILRGGEAVWSGTLRARSARAIALGRLGTDKEALHALAGSSRGVVLRAGEGSGIAWPALSDGHVRETRTRTFALAPPVPVPVLIALSLCALWWLRKRQRLD